MNCDGPMKKRQNQTPNIRAARARLRQLLDTLQPADSAVILPHNNPDPDAIASAVALQALLAMQSGIHTRILYKGVIGRAENRALVRYLEHPLERLLITELRAASHILLVDTQPHAGNNVLANQEEMAVTGVIDHHPRQRDAIEAAFVDVRPQIGAASTMLVEYLHAADMVPTEQLATALFYGIQTDTMWLQRGTAPSDHWAFCQLLPHVDFEAVARIQQAQVPPDYFRSIATMLQSATLYDNIIVANMGAMNYPDLTADMADLLLRMRGCRWVLCLGTHGDTLYFSLRTQNKRGAGQIAQQIAAGIGSAGGHGSMAGGQVPLDGADPDALEAALVQRFLEMQEISPDRVGEPLV